jgi:hypothetical protein
MTQNAAVAQSVIQNHHSYDSRHSESLCEEIIALYAAINAATHRWLKLVDVFDRGMVAQKNGFFTTAQWLSFYCGIGLNAAREKVRVARALAELPLIDSAFEKGEVSFSKVRALTRVAAPETEAALLRLARHASAAQTERILRDYRRTARSPSATDERPSMSWFGTEHGEVVFKVRLPAELGAHLINAIEAERDAQPLPMVDPNNVDAAPLREQRAEALLRLTESGLAHRDAASQAATASRYTVHVELNATTPEGVLNAHVRDGGELSRAAIERLTCDTSVVAHQLAADGETVNVGRKTRIIPGPLRRALGRRDRGCRFPGCTQHRFVDAHHVKHWAHGGETKLSNLVLLCRRHHRMIHEDGFRISVEKPSTGATRFVFFHPSGQKIAPVQDDLSGKVTPLHVTAVTSVRASPFAPIEYQARPDYDHIAWILGRYVPRE